MIGNNFLVSVEDTPIYPKCNANSKKYIKMSLLIRCDNCIFSKVKTFRVERCVNVVIGCRHCNTQESFSVQSLLHERLYFLESTTGLPTPRSYYYDLVFEDYVEGYGRMYY